MKRGWVRKRRSRKGQTALGLPFVFIISLIVMALVVLVAFYAIRHFTLRNEQLLVNDFVFSLKKEVESVYYMIMGSQTEFERELPSRIETVCVGDPSVANTAQVSEDVWFVITRYRGEEKNLFLFPEECLQGLGTSSAFNVPLLEAYENPFCVRNTGKIKVLLKNEGEYVSISVL